MCAVYFPINTVCEGSCASCCWGYSHTGGWIKTSLYEPHPSNTHAKAAVHINTHCPPPNWSPHTGQDFVEVSMENHHCIKEGNRHLPTHPGKTHKHTVLIKITKAFPEDFLSRSQSVSASALGFCS